MSTPRAKALAYAEKTREMQRSRPQPSTYSKPGPSKPMPSEIRENRAELDNIVAETKTSRNEEDTIKNDHKEREIDASDFDKPKVNAKQMPSNSTSADRPTPTVQLNSVYRDCWTTTSNIVIQPDVHDEKSSYVPSLIAYFQALFDMEENLHLNEELKYVARAYFSLPSRLYYAFIAIYTIYRSKEVAGTLTKAEGSWIRSFRRIYPEDSLPIAAPLIPFLQNLAAHKPDDAQFAFVYPTIPVTGTYKATPVENASGRTNLEVHSSHFLIPSIAMLGDLLKIFCTLQSITDANFDDAGNFVPFNPTTGGEFAGIHFPPIGNGYTNSFAKFLLNPALSRPLPEDKLRLREIHPYWKRSRAKGFPSPAANNGFEPTSPDDFMFSTNNLEWFGECRNMAIKQVSFFANSNNLSSISPLGDQATVVQVHLKLPEATQGLLTLCPYWYPDQFASVEAKFRSTSAELRQDAVFQAAYALTNCSISWRDSNDHFIGSLESTMRSGPFWENQKYNYIARHYQPVMIGVHAMIQSHFYNAHATEPTSF